MEIKKIEKLKSGKYKLIGDKESIVTYDEVILKNNLLNNKDIDSKLKNKIVKENSYYATYGQVLKYIGFRMRSLKEINQYLDKKNILDSDREKIICSLKKDKLIDDKLFCQSYINDKLNFTKSGINKIRKELLEHDIDEMIIEDAISKVDKKEEIEKLEKAIIKKIKLNTKYSKYQLKNKIIYEFSNLGYEIGDVINIFDNNYNDNDSLILEHAEKIRKKLSKKYSGDMLDYKVREKLYSKGFDVSSLNK